jgi:hypothetical protein
MEEAEFVRTVGVECRFAPARIPRPFRGDHTRSAIGVEARTKTVGGSRDRERAARGRVRFGPAIDDGDAASLSGVSLVEEGFRGPA